MLHLDPRSGEPIYLQVVNQIRHLVTVKHLKPHTQLPTVRQLALELKVDPNTIARAYTRLAAEGLISTQQGRGTYVLDVAPSVDQRRLRREKLMGQVEKFLSELDRLGYTPAEVEKIWGERFASWRRRAVKGR